MLIVVPLSAVAAPYAAFVIDARTGKVLHSRNADTKLHPASLTKMMTLYVVFQAIERGEISLDTVVKISSNAANEQPSKLGLKAGQKIKLRYLIRAAAVKSANDAATALGEAISGTEARFARRMTATARALGMTRTTFKNAHGLTATGHLSTARDMTTLGRHLFFDYPQFYNLFSRRTTDAGVREVSNTNRKFLAAYKGADGIKTGYTRAAGFNLVASAQRGQERIIATVFGGRSTASRNAKVAELLDLGFRRAPSRANIRQPSKPAYNAPAAPIVIAGNNSAAPSGRGKTIRVIRAVTTSLRPIARPRITSTEPVLVAGAAETAGTKDSIEQALIEAQAVTVAELAPAPASATSSATPPRIKPTARPSNLILASATPDTTPRPEPAREVVTRASTSGGENWGINVGRYPSRYKAERVLLKTALNEMSTLDGSLRRVIKRTSGFDANFLGLTRDRADLACRRLQARNVTCFIIGPG
ncbi:MAG: serine hydrolase [Rhodobacterales bacterium]|nr:serine hydrolase [Rhodobacterales bacterium]